MRPTRPLAFLTVLSLVAVALLVPAATAHPRGVFTRMDDSDYQPHTLIEPMPLEETEIRNATLGFVAEVSGQAIYDLDEEITTDPTIAYRMMGTPTSDVASDWLLERFQDLGYDGAYKQVFRLPCVALACGFAPGVETQLENVVGVLPGKDPTRWVVIGGHYDTREATVGALDNTMGTATVLHLAERFRTHADTHGPFEASIVFALWDGEEWGLFGSTRFLEDHSQAKEALGLAPDTPIEMLAALSFDMPGLNWPAKNTWTEYQGGEYAILNLRTSPIDETVEWDCYSYGCYEELKAADTFDGILQRFRNYQTLTHHIVHDWLGYPVEWVRVYDDSYGRSDHVPFLAAGIPGMRIQGSHDEEYPHYHQPTDTLENLAQIAGGKDLLIQGIETEARSGGGVAFYVASTGDVGHYDPQDPIHQGNTTPDDALRNETPMPPVPGILVLMLAGLFTARRPRRGR